MYSSVQPLENENGTGLSASVVLEKVAPPRTFEGDQYWCCVVSCQCPRFAILHASCGTGDDERSCWHSGNPEERDGSLVEHDLPQAGR